MDLVKNARFAPDCLNTLQEHENRQAEVHHAAQAYKVGQKTHGEVLCQELLYIGASWPPERKAEATPPLILGLNPVGKLGEFDLVLRASHH